MSTLLEQVANPQEPLYRIIPLTKGQIVLVDALDYEWLSRWHWYAFQYRTRGKIAFYAARRQTIGRRVSNILLMHRAIMQPPAGMIIDHKNLDGLDNRRENLRICTHQQNHQNQPRVTNNTTGYKGVSFDRERGKFTAQSKVNGKYIYIGRFASLIEAARAYDEFAKSHFGEFAFLNFPLDGSSSTVDPSTSIPPDRNS